MPFRHWRSAQEREHGAVVDVLQEGDEGLALIGLAVAPGKARQRRSKQNADGAADSAIENRHHR
jgi:hypothetical protein